MDEKLAVALSEETIRSKQDVLTAIQQGLIHGMNRAGRLFETEEYFIHAMYAGLEVLKPHLPRSQEQRQRVVIGVMQGDTHDIGKNLVKIMLDAAGYELIDLGRDISPQQFVDAAVEKSVHVIALSTLMTTTMDGMAEVIRLLSKAGRRLDFKVIVGGGPISQSFSDRIGADGYAADATGAVKLLKRLLEPVHA
jgi:methylmalonyl-CoA mutase cobalamin-binding domain/chain